VGIPEDACLAELERIVKLRLEKQAFVLEGAIGAGAGAFANEKKRKRGALHGALGGIGGAMAGSAGMGVLGLLLARKNLQKALAEETVPAQKAINMLDAQTKVLTGILAGDLGGAAAGGYAAGRLGRED